MSLFALPQTYWEEGTPSGYNETTGMYDRTELIQKSFRGTIQPLNSKELQSLPEGERDLGSVKVYSTTRLPVGKQGVKGVGALVDFAGEKYRCVRESLYNSGLINHFRYFAFLDNGRVAEPAPPEPEPVGD